DAALALALAAVMQIEVWLSSYAAHRALLAPLAALATCALVLRAHRPLAATLVTLGALGAIPIVSPGFDNESITFVAVYFVALYSLGAHARGWHARLGALVVLAEIAFFVADDGDPFHFGDLAFGTFLVCGPWAAGVAIRLR